MIGRLVDRLTRPLQEAFWPSLKCARLGEHDAPKVGYVNCRRCGRLIMNSVPSEPTEGFPETWKGSSR